MNERLHRAEVILHPIHVLRKTAQLLNTFPIFQAAIRPVFSPLLAQSASIQTHYGVKYEEMGFCTKAFADVLDPAGDNTDIGMAATTFYVFLDTLDDMIDDPTCSPRTHASILTQAGAVLTGKKIDNADENFQALRILSCDLHTRVEQLSITTVGKTQFLNQCLKTIDALYKENRPQPQIRRLVTLAMIGRACTDPLMELIACKYGATFPPRSVGNLVAIGNILDDYWDVVKDHRARKQTFLTMRLPENEIPPAEIVLHLLQDMRSHVFALRYCRRLFSRAMWNLPKEWREEALAIALFAQIGVLKRRYATFTHTLQH